MWYKIKAKLKKCKLLKPLINFRRKRIDKKLVELTHKYGYSINTLVNDTLGNNFEYYAWSGTLLGVVRESAFIKYDNDLDYAIVIPEEKTWEELYQLLQKAGLTYHHHFEKDGIITEIAFRYKGVHVDFFGVYKSGETAKYWFGAKLADKEYNQGEFTPVEVEFSYQEGVQTKKVMQTQFNIPNFFNEFLVANYGEDYMTPIKGVSVETKCGKRKNINDSVLTYKNDFSKQTD